MVQIFWLYIGPFPRPTSGDPMAIRTAPIPRNPCSSLGTEDRGGVVAAASPDQSRSSCFRIQSTDCGSEGSGQP